MASAWLHSPPRETLLRVAAPIALGMVSTFLFQVVDTAFVAQLGPGPLAALGFTAPVYLLLVCLLMGMAVGVSALVGAALGRDDRPHAERLSTTGLLLFLGLSAAFGGLGIALGDPLFRLLGAGPETLPAARAYMDILLLGGPLLAAALAIDAAVRADGDVTRPALLMGFAGVVNVGLDAVLIFGLGPVPALGLEGAAWATVGAWAFAAVGMLGFLWKHRLLTRHGVGRDARRLLVFSAPAIATQVLVPMGAALLTALAARSGAAAVAALGVATRVESLALVGISALAVAVVPVVAVNHGAGASDRVLALVRTAGRLAMAWGLGAGVLLLALGGPVASLFGDDPEIVSLTQRYFWLVGPTWAGLGVLNVTASTLNGIQRPGEALRVLALKLFAFTAPFAVLGSLAGPPGLFVGIGVAHVVGGLAGWRRLRTVLPALAEAAPAPDPA